MKVNLITYTQNPELTVAMAHKACYSSSGLSEIISKGMTEDEIVRHIRDAVTSNHKSVLEHASFTFAIEGISRACSHQLVRHRIASYSQKSQRYVNMDDFEYITPPEIKDDSSTAMVFDKAMSVIAEQYNKIYSDLFTKYQQEGMLCREARTKAQENARAVLPNACETQLIMTMNASSLLHFFELRCCNRAQDEIRNLAEEMLRQCKKVAPNIFATAGAPCIRGNCPEGKMSCGKPKSKEEI